MFSFSFVARSRALANQVRRVRHLAPLVLILPIAACEEPSSLLEPSQGKPAFAASAGPALIAYADGESGGIYLIAEDGTGPRSLTGMQAGILDRFPDFAPGNRTLLFTRIQGANSELYTITTSGRRLRQLTNLGGENKQGTYSPSGKRIAFIHQDQLYLLNANGADATPAISTPARLGSPSWAPDGGRIAFEVFNSANTTWHIGVMDVATSGWYTMQCPAACHTPRWSPKGDVLVVELEGAAGTSVLQYVPANSPAFTPFETSPAGLNQVGGWSPDGSKFVFSSTRFDGVGDLLIRDAQGAIIPLTSGVSRDFQPTWSR